MEVQQKAVTKKTYGKNITHHRFVATPGWAKDFPFNDQNAALYQLFYHLQHTGAVADVVVCNGKTSLHGSSTKLIDQRDLIAQVWKDEGPMVVTTAGLYIHYPEYLREDYNEKPLGQEHYQQPVGLTSLGPEHFPIPKSMSEFYQKITLDDGFFHAPKLDGQFPNEAVDPSRINTAAGKLQYRAQDTTSGAPIPNPFVQERKKTDAFFNEIKERQKRGDYNLSMDSETAEFDLRGMVPITQADGTVKRAEHRMTDPLIRTSHSYVGGGLAMGNQPNERQAAIKIKNGPIIHVALTVGPDPETTKRNGWTFDTTDFLREAILEYLGHSLDEIEWKTTVDGGPSVLIAILGGNTDDAGQPRMANLIAKGGQKAQALPLAWSTADNWRINNAVMVTDCGPVIAE